MSKRKKEIIGILLIALAVIVLISQISFNPTEEPTISPDVATRNTFGIFGVYIAHYLIKNFLGWGSLVMPIILAISGITIFLQKGLKSIGRIISYLILTGILTSIWLSVPQFYSSVTVISFHNSGLIGGTIGRFIHDFTGFFGLITILTLLSVFLITGYFKISISDIVKEILIIFKSKIAQIKEKRRLKKITVTSLDESKVDTVIEQTSPEIEEFRDIESDDVEINESIEEIEPIIETDKIDVELVVETDQDKDLESAVKKPIQIDQKEDAIEIGEVEEIQQGDLDALKERQSRYKDYKLPSINLLSKQIEFDETATKELLTDKASHLEHALETFGVQGKIVRISPGPVITLFEVEPGEGVRVNKFTNLSDDLARVMKAQSVRIIAPIPGSKTVGIELPNDSPEIVYMRNVINSEKYIQSNSKLTLAIGRTTSGDAYVYDLAKMPHLLIAGATGAGKSVCINTIIISILYKAKPDEVKFILIDPKKLELSAYKSLVGYHLTTSPDIDEYVMTTADNAVAVLRAALIEMERRYEVFADATVRNIAEYLEKAETNSEMEKIPYLIVIIDELADLMLTSGRDVEEPITRLAQMARAVGIHLIVATQRPSVDVITGLIKANFPARIAFQVSSRVDSRTIIDQIGAEKLLGRGDMLFLPPGKSSPLRLHNALITLEEIENILSHITNQPKPEEKHLPKAKQTSGKSEFSLEGQDELLMDAAKMVIEHQQASVSLLQRKFRIGYSRAGRLVDELEAMGIISGYSGSKAREVLVDSSYLDTLAQ